MPPPIITKQQGIHIAAEAVVFGVFAYYVNSRNQVLNENIKELHNQIRSQDAKIELLLREVHTLKIAASSHIAYPYQQDNIPRNVPMVNPTQPNPTRVAAKPTQRVPNSVKVAAKSQPQQRNTRDGLSPSRRREIVTSHDLNTIVQQEPKKQSVVPNSTKVVKQKVSPPKEISSISAELGGEMLEICVGPVCYLGPREISLDEVPEAEEIEEIIEVEEENIDEILAEELGELKAGNGTSSAMEKVD